MLLCLVIIILLLFIESIGVFCGMVKLIFLCGVMWLVIGLVWCGLKLDEIWNCFVVGNCKNFFVRLVLLWL